MLSKSGRNLGTRRKGNLSLQICYSQSMVWMTLSKNLQTTSPRHRTIRVKEIQRMTLGGGVTSTKSPGTTPMNVTQNNHWWPRSKTRSWTLIQNLILKILVKDRSLMQTPPLLSRPQQFNQKNKQILKRGRAFFIHKCGWRVPHCILLLIVESRRTSSQQRSSNSWDCRQQHTCRHTQSGGFDKDEISVSANSVDYHMASNPSRIRYYVMLPHWMSVMFSWTNHICGDAMLFMSLDPIVSFLLWGVISKEYKR